MTKRVTRKSVNMVGSQEYEDDESQDLENRGMEEAIQDFAEGKNIIKLYRHPNELTGGRPRLLCSLAREDFNDVYVLNRFGGGKYFGRWRLKNGQYTRFNFDIDGEPKVFTREVEEAQQHTQEQEGNPYGFLKRGEQEKESQEDPDRGIGTADILRIIAETRRESRDEMRMLLELMRPQMQPQPDATEKVFSLVEKIVPLITQGGNDGSGGNPWLFALAQLKEPLMKMVDTIHTAVTQPKPAPAGSKVEPVRIPPSVGGATNVPRSDLPEPLSPVPAPEPEPKSEDDMFVESFRPYLGMLMKAAAEGKDPALYADLILDQTPVFAYDRLRVWLNKAGCLDDLAKLDQAVYHDRGWWTALRGLLVEALNEELGHAVRPVQSSEDSDPPEGSPTTRA
jgi:hypothetical protein